MNPFYWLISLLIPCITAQVFHHRVKKERELMAGSRVPKPGHTAAPLNYVMLPCLLAIWPILFPLLMGAKRGFYYYAANLFDLLLIILVYYLLLFLLHPVLRKLFQPQATSTLWLLPNLVYFTRYGSFSLVGVKPKILISIPSSIALILLFVWLGGAVISLGIQIIGHLHLRKRLLSDAVPENTPWITDLFQEEARRAEQKRPIPLLRSPNTKTPISIGLFSSSLRVLLPTREYSKEELRLIFRHELRHIHRLDTEAKLCLGIFRAILWFFPPFQRVLELSSQEMELSCDEAVLTEADDATRKKYASLLINEAGQEQGFTTCLSARAEGLKYRMSRVLHPQKRLDGTFFLVIVGSLLLLCSFWCPVRLSTSSGTVGELLSVPAGIENAVFRVYVTDREVVPYRAAGGYGREIYEWDPELIEFIASLPIRRVDGLLAPEKEDETNVELYISRGSTATMRLVISQDMLICGSPRRGDEEMLTGVYLLQEPLDKEALYALMDFDAPNPDPDPIWPELYAPIEWVIRDESLPEPERNVTEEHLPLRVLSITDGEGTIDRRETSGDDGRCYCIGVEIPSIELRWSYAPESMELTAAPYYQEDMRSTESAGLLISEEHPEKAVLTLADCSAVYTLRGQFRSNRETIYDTETVITIIRPRDVERYEQELQETYFVP